jgi:NAD(P)H dehydrogenase (quinone)
VAEAVKQGIETAGGEAHILQVPETLSAEALSKRGAPPKGDYPIISAGDLVQYDAYVLGISTRHGGMSAQMKTFWDSTGQLWASGALAGKFAAAFMSTGGQGGGQESGYYSVLTTLVHHGLIFVPLVSGPLKH